jgi:hypothetical protein
MFKNILKHSSIVAIVIVALVTGVLVGCQKDDDYFTVDNGEVDGYLSLTKGFDLLNLSVEESQIFQTAFSRMSLFSEDGIIKTKVTSGHQIHISEDLFAFFNEAIHHSNQLKGVKLSPPRLKSGNNESSNSNNDCVAYTIQSLLSSFGISKSVSEINTWIVSQYGSNGVPNTSIYQALNHFVITTPTSLPSSYSYSSNSTSKIVVIERISSSEGHSGVLVNVSGGYALYQDNQNGGYRTCPVSNISSAYSISGAR